MTDEQKAVYEKSRQMGHSQSVIEQLVEMSVAHDPDDFTPLGLVVSPEMPAEIVELIRRRKAAASEAVKRLVAYLRKAGGDLPDEPTIVDGK